MLSRFSIVPLCKADLYAFGMDMGHRIAIAREHAELTQADVARALGITRPAVSQWEAGKTKPSREKLRAFAKLTSTNPEWLETGEGPMEAPAREPEPRGSRKAVELADEIMALSSEGKLSDEAVAAIEQLVRTMSGD